MRSTRFAMNPRGWTGMSMLMMMMVVRAEWLQQAKLTTFDAKAQDQFGTSAALQGYTAVLGAPQDDETASNSGAAFVYTRDSDAVWTKQDKLINPNSNNANQKFGSCVAVYQDLLVVGAPVVASTPGQVFFYRLGLDLKWTLQQTITPTTALTGFAFGTSCALDDTTLVVGAPFRSAGALPTGAAYTFELNAVTGLFGGSLEIRGSKTVSSTGDSHGQAVAIAGDYLAVSSPLADPSGFTDAGGFFVFKRNTTNTSAWIQDGSMLIASDPVNGDNLGSSIDIDGTTVVVGAPNADRAGSSASGAAYIFILNPKNSSWIQYAKLTASDAALQGSLGDVFGTAVAISGTTIVVGAPKRDLNRANPLDEGGFYVYSRALNESWSQESIRVATGQITAEYVGSALALDDYTLVVGAPGDNAKNRGVASGSAYIFVEGVLSSAPPSSEPSEKPSPRPSQRPSRRPSHRPSRHPTVEPTSNKPVPLSPSSQPSTDPCAQKSRCGSSGLESYFLHKLDGPKDNQGQFTSCSTRCVYLPLISLFQSRGWTCGRCPLGGATK